MELLNMIQSQHPESIYALAKLVGRSVENVHTDIQLLDKEGLVKQSTVKDVRKKVIPEVTFSRITLNVSLTKPTKILGVRP
jgi:predicted transcriptional regulator